MVAVRIDVEMRQRFRQDALAEVQKVFPDVNMAGSFEEALVNLEQGNVEGTKAFLLFYTIYSEKCEDYADRINQHKDFSEENEIDDSWFDTKDFLKKKLDDWTK